MKQWAWAAHAEYGMRTALLGLIIAAHFNSLRTWGVLSQAFGHQVDWEAATLLLEKCGTLWGQNGHLALYGATNMSGCGLLPHGETYVQRFAYWFKQIPDHCGFQRASDILERGIHSFAEAQQLDTSLRELRGAIKGLLGPYHFKMLHDFLVAARFLPPRWVFTYPVSPSGGTAKGLRRIFEVAGRQTGTQACAVMLQELTFHVQRKSTSWWASDHLGSVGAALCWQHRQASASTAVGHSNRLQQTSHIQWEKQLRDLQQHGYKILGFHRKACEQCDGAACSKT